MLLNLLIFLCFAQMGSNEVAKARVIVKMDKPVLLAPKLPKEVSRKYLKKISADLSFEKDVVRERSVNCYLSYTVKGKKKKLAHVFLFNLGVLKLWHTMKHTLRCCTTLRHLLLRDRKLAS